MYSIFHMEEGENVLRAVLANKSTDIFADLAIKNLGWEVADLTVYNYSSDKLLGFQLWANDKTLSHQLHVDPATFALQKVEKSPALFEKVFVEFDADNASDFYSQEEIDSAAAIKVIIDAWAIANPNPVRGDATPDPDFGANVPPVMQSYKNLVPQTITVIDSITADLIDLPARLAAEQAALNAGSTQISE